MNFDERVGKISRRFIFCTLLQWHNWSSSCGGCCLCAVMCWILHVVEHEQESTAHRRCDLICQKSHIRFLTHYGAATCHSCMYMHSARYKLNGENKKSLSYKCSCSKEHVFFALSKLKWKKKHMVQLLRNM